VKRFKFVLISVPGLDGLKEILEAKIVNFAAKQSNNYVVKTPRILFINLSLHFKENSVTPRSF